MCGCVVKESTVGAAGNLGSAKLEAKGGHDRSTPLAVRAESSYEDIIGRANPQGSGGIVKGSLRLLLRRRDYTDALLRTTESEDNLDGYH